MLPLHIKKIEIDKVERNKRDPINETIQCF